MMSLDLNTSIESASFTESGREFHVVGPQIPNERSPNWIVFDGDGAARQLWHAERGLDRRWFVETLTQ